MILLDTHTLIWWLTQDRLLPSSVRNFIQQHIHGQQVYVSAMSIWEIAMLYRKGRLQLAYDLETWIDQALASPGLQWVPADSGILLKSVILPDPFHPDPADRIIVATAMNLGAILVTKDGKIREYPYVRSFWKE